ncbi:MAG TPA: division/cell wall cluster transcriptional repressor MraZ [Flavobacteriales bacterium]|nr:division/cell wall cluster transcriptional repressor MraZ [Flavobacteriales bacterium]
MKSFIGEYDCKVDDKGRFVLPAGIKKQIDPAAEETFVINRGFEKCLVLYPKNEWDGLLARVRKKVNLFEKKGRMFMRMFQNGATIITLDSSGRLLLPSTLTKYAGLKKDVLLFAYADRMEIWDKALYEQEMNANLTGFADLAEDLLGDPENGGNDE